MSVPYCVMAKSDGARLRTIRVPEAQIAHRRRQDWSMLIRDTEMPFGGEQFRWLELQSGPQRHRYRVDADFWREGGA